MINYDVEEIDVQKEENMLGRQRLELFDKSNLCGEDSFLLNIVQIRLEKSMLQKTLQRVYDRYFEN